MLALGGVGLFRSNKTSVNPLNTDSVSSLVTSGIYNYSRNPMYLGMLFWLIGYACYIANPLNLVFLVLFVCYMNKFQIAPEEAFLKQKFAESYHAYSQKVRRWL